MSFHHKYHRLFEVRLLHEYYLLGEDGASFYDLSPSDRVALLEKRLLSGQYNLMNDLLVVPTKATKELLDKRRLRLVQNFTGFAVVGRGESAALLDGTPAIKPMIALDEKLELLFRISIKEPRFKNYTSLPLRRPQEGGYYFSNAPSNVQGAGFLSMSQSVADFVPGTDYAPGDLARFAGVLREANAMTNSNANWDNIESDGYVNETDRIVLNSIFRYRPTESELGGAFGFVLKQPNGGAVVKTINVPSMPFLGQRLDFSEFRADVLSDPVPIKPGLYDLEITKPSGQTTRSVYLHPEHESPDAGLVHIRFSETDAAYSIIGSEGQLREPHPVFEIRYRSRRTFWRYVARQSTKRLMPLNSDVAGHFLNEANANATANTPTKLLVTKTPQKLTYLPFGVTGGGGPSQLLPKPQPSPFSVKKDSELMPGEPPGRIYSEVQLASVDSMIKAVN